MKIAILVFLMSSFFGCYTGLDILMRCDPDEPDPPFGKPDDISRFEFRGTNSVTYVYRCYQGRYYSITYSQKGCDNYMRESVLELSGICP